MFSLIIRKVLRFLELPIEGKKLEEPCQLIKARRYVGMQEQIDRKSLKSLMGLDPVETPWCTAFITAIEQQCGRAGIKSLVARKYLNYGKAIQNPELGDIVVFQRGNSSWQGHVGYYISENRGRILVLGGNQDNEVNFSYYPKHKVLGYRRPL